MKNKLPYDKCHLCHSQTTEAVCQWRGRTSRRLHVLLSVSCATPQGSVGQQGDLLFCCVLSILTNKPQPPTLTFNLCECSIQTPPSSSCPPIEDKTARRPCLDGSRQVQRPDPTISGRKSGDLGWRPWGEGVGTGRWKGQKRGALFTPLTSLGKGVGFLRRVVVKGGDRRRRRPQRSQVQGKQPPNFFLCFSFAHSSPTPSSNDQRWKSSLSSLVKRWWRCWGGGATASSGRGEGWRAYWRWTGFCNNVDIFWPPLSLFRIGCVPFRAKPTD